MSSKLFSEPEDKSSKNNQISFSVPNETVHIWGHSLIYTTFQAEITSGFF